MIDQPDDEGGLPVDEERLNRAMRDLEQFERARCRELVEMASDACFELAYRFRWSLAKIDCAVAYAVDELWADEKRATQELVESARRSGAL